MEGTGVDRGHPAVKWLTKPAYCKRTLENSVSGTNSKHRHHTSRHGTRDERPPDNMAASLCRSPYTYEPQFLFLIGEDGTPRDSGASFSGLSPTVVTRLREYQCCPGQQICVCSFQAIVGSRGWKDRAKRAGQWILRVFEHVIASDHSLSQSQLVLATHCEPVSGLLVVASVDITNGRIDSY